MRNWTEREENTISELRRDGATVSKIAAYIGRSAKAVYWKLEELSPRREVVLVIPDLHEPFALERALDFCKAVYKKYNCTRVMFLGDLIDNHYASYHESDPDGHSAAEELRKAKERIERFYEAFPVADVCIGNHDRIPNRKAMSGGLSTSWMKTISEVLETTGWNYKTEHIIDGVLYVHGERRTARMRALMDRISVVQGHRHTEAYYVPLFDGKTSIFAMQLSCLIDRNQYAFAYASDYQHQHLNVGVVFNGKHGVIENYDISTILAYSE